MDGDSGAMACPVRLWSAARAFRGQGRYRAADDLGTNTFFHLLYIAALAAGIWGIAMYWLAGYIYTEQGIRLLRKELGEKYGA